MLISLAAAGVMAAQCFARAGVKGSMVVGPPNWDFTKSWATNITILGGVFATVFANKVVNSPRFVPDPGYPMLSVLFAVLVLVAPLAFVAISKVKPVQAKPSRRRIALDVEHQGTATAFVIAMVLTLWGALGQILTLGALGVEVLAAGKAPSATTALLVVLLIAAVATVVYAQTTALALLRHRKARMAKRGDPGFSVEELLEESRGVGVLEPVSSWTLL